MKECPLCGEAVNEKATHCEHCSQRIVPKAPIWPWLVGAPVALLAVMIFAGSQNPEKNQARQAISKCWESVDDDIAELSTRRSARRDCLILVERFESKYGPAPSLRRE